MNKRGKVVVRILLAGLALVLAISLGWTAAMQSGQGSRNSTGTAGYGKAPQFTADSSVVHGSATKGALVAGAPSPEALTSSAASTESPMIVTTASMAVRVADVSAAVKRVRDIAAANGAEVSDLVVSGGDGGNPRPLDELTVEQQQNMPNPGSADITLRVPADKLPAVEDQVAKLGRVLNQSASQNDVTQQHIDLTARLKNLQAEEERLRGFLGKATKVSEMLDVERELSRIRGDIESMQAQVDYLERQAAKSTLTISLSEPPAVTNPGSGGWGFDTALRDGILATAALARTLVTVAIPLAAIALPLVAIWLVVRTIRRRRFASAAQGGQTEADRQDDGEGSQS
jgi:hypothetical protein